MASRTRSGVSTTVFILYGVAIIASVQSGPALAHSSVVATIAVPTTPAEAQRYSFLDLHGGAASSYEPSKPLPSTSHRLDDPHAGRRF